MNELIKIGNQEITLKEFRGQRVVTFKDIDLVHERPEGTAKRNFSENAERFIEGEDFHLLKQSEAQKDEIRTLEIPNRGLVVITEQGYLMLVKSFTDDLAWKVQRDLVSTYFKRNSIIEGMSPELQAIIMQDKKLQAIVLHIESQDKKVQEVNEDLQTFKLDMPLLGLECDRITTAVRAKGVKCLGGKESNAYQDSSLRSRVYSDIYGQLKREFGLTSYKAIKRCQTETALSIIESYELPMALAEEINDLNAQMVM